MNKNETIIREIYYLVSNDKNDKALDILFDAIDELLCDYKFKETDDMLQMFDLNKLNITLMLGLLTITFAAREKLSTRKDLYIKIREKILLLDPERCERLLQGLI